MIPFTTIKRKLLVKNIPNSRLQSKSHTLFMTKMPEKSFNGSKLSRSANISIPLGAAHTYIAHIREYPPPLEWKRSYVLYFLLSKAFQ